MIIEGGLLKNIIKGCKKNDIHSKELMYKAFYGYLISVILRYVAKHDDAEELVNDCFMKIYKNIDSFENYSDGESYLKAFKGWIATIASRTSIDHLRKDKKHFLVDELDKVDYQLHTTVLNDQLEVKEILALLDKLPETHRLVFNLHVVEGFSHDEIAQMLHIPSSSSRVFLTRAKNKLRILYQQQFNAV